MNPDEFYKTLTSLPEQDQVDVINAMSTEDAKLLSDYQSNQQSPSTSQQPDSITQLPEMVVNGNRPDQQSYTLSQTSPSGISLDGLTPEQQAQVIERDSPLIKPIQDGTIRDALGGGAAANMVENVAQGVTNVARASAGTLKAVGNFIGGNPAEQLADTLRFENQLDQEGSTGVNRMGRLVSHHLGQLAASTARSPLAPVPTVKGFTAAKGAWGATKAIAGNFAVDFGMIGLIEGTAQALEALGDQSVGDANKRVTDTLGTAAIGAGFGAAARTVGALAKGGLSKLAVSYDKSQNAQKIVSGLADNVNKAKETMDSFTSNFEKVKVNLAEKKRTIDNKVLLKTQQIESKVKSKAINELSAAYKSKEGIDSQLYNINNEMASLSNEAINIMSRGESVVRGSINKSYDNILVKGTTAQQAVDVSNYIDDIANQLSFIGKEDAEISTAFIGSMKKILPGISFNKIDDAARTLMDTGGSLTVKQAHTLRVDMNDIIRKKINDPKLYDQMVALRNISDRIGDDIGEVAGKEYKATNALYSQYLDSSNFIDRYVGPLETSIKPMPGQNPLKRQVTRLKTADTLNEFADVAPQLPSDIEGFFKGKGADTSPLVKQLELQNTAVQSFYKQIDLFEAVGKTAEADALRSSVSLYAKQMVNKKGLVAAQKDAEKMLAEYTNPNVEALVRNSPEMQLLLTAKEADLKAISDRVFNLDRGATAIKEGTKEIQSAAKKQVDVLKNTDQMSESDVMSLNSTLTQIGWSSGSQPLKMAMINIAAWNSLLHYAPRLASNAMKSITKVENALLAKQNADDIARVARKGIENADNFVRSKKLTVSQKSAWTWALETIGYERNDKYEKDRKQKEALQNLDL